MPTFKIRPMTPGKAPEPAKARLRPLSPSRQSPAPALGAKPASGRTTYTPEQEATATRCRAAGMSKAETATAAGLTHDQVHYLWYVKPRQQQQAKARAAERLPLVELVPEPITTAHTRTLPDHTYHGHKTAYRSDVIEQVKRCKGHGHSTATVGRYFGLSVGAVRYIWYQVPDNPGKPSERMTLRRDHEAGKEK